jgi:hypothetical protein
MREANLRVPFARRTIAISLLVLLTTIGCSREEPDTSPAPAVDPPSTLSQPTKDEGVQSSDTEEFTDTAYGYSVHVPRSWERLAITDSQPDQRVAFVTPLKSSVIVSIKRLERPVTKQSKFESIAEEQVDPIIDAYRQAYDLTTIFGEDKQDRSDDVSMRFWQGTSASRRGDGPIALISLHAIKYGSTTMINIVYTHGGGGGEMEIDTLDSFMNTLAFTNP